MDGGTPVSRIFFCNRVNTCCCRRVGGSTRFTSWKTDVRLPDRCLVVNNSFLAAYRPFPTLCFLSSRAHLQEIVNVVLSPAIMGEEFQRDALQPRAAGRNDVLSRNHAKNDGRSND